jgi:hypothetical protein
MMPACAYQIEKVKTVFAERERQTAEDLLQLEQLHAHRVSKLQAVVAQTKQQLADSQGTLNKLQTHAQKSSAHSQQNADRYNAVVQTHVLQADNLRRQLEQAHAQAAEAAVRESAYREKLTVCMEESRIMRAELLEAQRQLNSGTNVCCLNGWCSRVVYNAVCPQVLCKPVSGDKWLTRVNSLTYKPSMPCASLEKRSRIWSRMRNGYTTITPRFVTGMHTLKESFTETVNAALGLCASNKKCLRPLRIHQCLMLQNCRDQTCRLYQAQPLVTECRLVEGYRFLR